MAARLLMKRCRSLDGGQNSTLFLFFGRFRILSDSYRDKGHSHEFGSLVFLEDGLEDLLGVGKIDEHAQFASALSHLPLRQITHLLQILGPRECLS